VAFGPFADHFSLLRRTLLRQNEGRGAVHRPPHISGCCLDCVALRWVLGSVLPQGSTFVQLGSLFELQTGVFVLEDATQCFASRVRLQLRNAK
jgi:hypothetical protein